MALTSSTATFEKHLSNIKISYSETNYKKRCVNTASLKEKVRKSHESYWLLIANW